MNCIIVDDDELSRLALRHCVERTENLTLIAECENANDALAYIRSQQIDLIFLDIEMPEMSGIDFIRNFQDLPQIIFVTINNGYRAEAFDYNVTDFIIKPIEYSRFIQGVDKAREINETIQVGNEGDSDIFIKKDNRLIKVDVKEINWIEALADYVNIYSSNGRLTVLSTMKSIEQKLPFNEFARVHRSYIIRIDKISQMNANTLKIGEQIIPISRTYKEKFLIILNLIS
jgi:DNA-binding LytR/AlgR family response regulator